MIKALLFAAMASVCSASTALAQDAKSYPNHPVRFIVPFAAGGGTDSQARIIAESMAKALGQPFVVENQGGAGGTIGINTVARANPDGYTIMATTPSFVINPYIQNVAYDPTKDFAPVIQTTTSPAVMVVPPASPIKSVKDLIDEARAHPGEILFGSAGIGSFSHLSAAVFAAKANVKLTHVPYRGTGPALIDLMARRLQVQFENAPGVLSQIKSGQLRAVAVGTATKSPMFPNLPTIAETVPGYEASSWLGILVPTKTPRPVIDKLNATLNKVLQDPTVKKRLVALGLEIVGGTSDDYGAYLKAKLEEVKLVAGAAGLKSN